MPLQVYAEAEREFRAAVEELRSLIAFVSTANRVRPWIMGMVDRQRMGNAEIEALTAFVSQKDYHVEVGYNGLVVALAGAFENLVRRLIKDGVVWLNRKYDRFETMLDSVRQHNLCRSGHILTTVFDPPVEMVIDFESICRNLGTCRTGGGTLVLNADAFAASVSNVNAKRIDDAFERIGIELNWDAIGADAPLQALLGHRKPRDAANAMKQWLKDFIATRNRIAHTGVAVVQTLESTIQGYLQVLATFAPLLAQEIENSMKRTHT